VPTQAEYGNVTGEIEWIAIHTLVDEDVQFLYAIVSYTNSRLPVVK